MKTASLLIVFLLGGIIGYEFAKYVGSNKSQEVKVFDSQNTESKWTWSDSLDAVKKAPKCHKNSV